MIARPLDLAARLSPPPRRLEYVFFINLALIGLFFQLWGSRFVLAPGLQVDFLPNAEGVRTGAVSTSDYISVLGSGQILTGEGMKGPGQLEDWMKRQASLRAAHPVAKGAKPSLLILASRDVSLATLTRIISLANNAGFATTVIAAQEPAGP